MKDWYSDHEFYHKVGYLIASGYKKSLSDIYEESKDKKKSEFREILNGFIRDSINIGDKNYAELSYEEPGDVPKISRLLLLFNVESVRKIDEQSRWFSFAKFKASDQWTLEHIHAQQSEGMNTQKEWRMWLEDHVQSLKSLENPNKELIQEIEELLDRDEIKTGEFKKLQEKAIAELSVEGIDDYMHTIGNLALLNGNDNAALSNSAFDVKRNKIIERDQQGLYIPYGTKMVFLKYYTPSAGNQVHFWGTQDRIAYLKAINHTIGEYMDEDKQIVIEEA
jgi:hypothetical protein